MMIDEQGNSLKRAIFISGQITLTSISGVMMRNNLFLSLLVLQVAIIRGFLLLKMVIEKQTNVTETPHNHVSINHI
jgi:hypothetical protein